MNALAQTRVMTLDEIFSIADNNNKTLKASRIAIDEAEQNVSVARSANLPQVDISLYGGYLGNIWLADKDYSNGHWYSTPHFQTDFSVTATEVIYAGGAISNNIKMSTLKKTTCRAFIQKRCTKCTSASFGLLSATITTIQCKKNI